MMHQHHFVIDDPVICNGSLIDQGYPLSHVRLLQDCEPPEGASGGVVKVIPEQGIFSDHV